MKKKYLRKSNIAVIFAIIFSLASRYAEQHGASLSGPLQIIGFPLLWIVACYFYAKSKGRHGAWGLLGILSIFGLIILYYMKDKSAQAP